MIKKSLKGKKPAYPKPWAFSSKVQNHISEFLHHHILYIISILLHGSNCHLLFFCHARVGFSCGPSSAHAVPSWEVWTGPLGFVSRCHHKLSHWERRETRERCYCPVYKEPHFKVPFKVTLKRCRSDQTELFLRRKTEYLKTWRKILLPTGQKNLC